MALGLVPGAITAVLFVLMFVLVAAGLDPASSWLADRWVGAQSPWHDLAQWVVAMALLAAAILVAVYAFVTTTSVVGQPFFEALSHRIDDRLGPVAPGPEWPWWRNALRGIGEGVRLSVLTVPLSLGVALIGLIPAVGTVAAWTVGALLGGWFVALEFTAVPFERRGMRLRERRAGLGSRRALTVGFGAMAYLMAIVTPIAVVMMPAAVAGGTLLAREIFDGTPPPRRVVGRELRRRQALGVSSEASAPVVVDSHSTGNDR